MASGKSSLLRQGTLLAVAVLCCVVATSTPALAHEGPAVSAVGVPNPPVAKPGSNRLNLAPSVRCTDLQEGQRGACVQVSRSPGKGIPPGTAGPVPLAVLPVPQWCIDNAFDGLYALRTSACEIYVVTYTTYTVTNGVRVPTGEATFNLYNYTYSAVDLPNFAHQVQIQLNGGFGPAMAASVSGSASASGACTTSFSSFPAQPIQPVAAMRGGEAQFNTTAVAPGGVGSCRTTWNLLFTNANHTPASLPVIMDEIRCDNAIGANGFRPARVGCVVPWYASAVLYSQSRNPTLAAHVAQAQGSGLPGNSFLAPLVKTSNPTIVNANRNRACGDAPSIAGRSCDEYPLASTLQGLSGGGTRRTFSGCNINAPSGTGPLGASACMISATDNNSQGGQMAAFYYDARVLDNDPYRVLVTA